MHHASIPLLFALLVADSAAVPVAVGQQVNRYAFEDTILKPVQHFDASRFDSVTAVSLRAILDSAAARGLPTAPLVNQALMGAARRAPGSRILMVVRAHAAAMADARKVIGERSSTAELDVAAQAMRHGVDGGTLSQLRQARAGSTIIKPLVVAIDLINRGIPFAATNNAVVTISRLSKTDELLDGMQALVAKNAIRGGPTMASEALERYLRETVAANATRNPSGTVIRDPDR